ncbi:hypothetical protein GCM10027048_01330 [Hymenobacter coalescens]
MPPLSPPNPNKGAAGTTHGDVVSPGENAWILHTPDDPDAATQEQRRTLYLAPAYQVLTVPVAQSSLNGNPWDFTQSFQFTHNGTLRVPSRLAIGVPLGEMGALKLAVEGDIGARGVWVRAQAAPWPDYVFAPGYRLPSLRDTEQFVRRYRHLPGVPSAAQVQQHGVELASLNAVLLQKVEELTLHLIALEKDKEQLRQRLQKLETAVGGQ